MQVSLISKKSFIYPKSYSNVSFKQNNQLDIDTGRQASLDNKNSRLLRDLKYPYNQIQDILNKKTFAGINSIILEHKGFNTVDGLTFKNIDGTNKNVSFELKTPKGFSTYTKILVKDQNDNIEDGFLIKDDLYIIKNYNLKTPNKIPDTPEFYSVSELAESHINDRLSNLLVNIDNAMCDVRKFVNKRKDTDLKPTPATVNNNVKSSICCINYTTKKINEMVGNISPKTLNRYKTEFGDYCFKEGQIANMFKNVGANKEKLVFSTVNNSYFGQFSKLLVFNEDDSLKTGYLLYNDKIVSNYNPEYPGYIPDKLNFVDVKEINNKHYSDDLENYLKLYEEKLNEFQTFLSQKKRTSMGMLSCQHAEKMQDIASVYDEISESLSKYSLTTVNKIKGEYPDFDLKAPKRGFTFVNVGPEKKEINILKMKSPNEDKLFKIILLNPDGTDDTEIVIKNATQLVNNYKISEEETLAKLNILNYLDDLNEKLKDFDKFVTQRGERPRKKTAVLAQDLNSPVISETKKHNRISCAKIKFPALSKEQKQEVVKDFGQALKNMNGDIINFDDEIAKIREKLLVFVSKNNSYENV